MKRRLLSYMAMLLVSISAVSIAHSSVITLDKESNSLQINAQIEYLQSASENLDIYSIHNFFSDRFTSNQRKLIVVNLSEGDLWLRATIDNPGESSEDRILKIDTPSAINLQQFIPDIENQFVVIETGKGVSFTERPLSSATPALSLKIPAGQSHHYFKVSGEESALIDLRLQNPVHFYQQKFKQDMLYGALLALFVLLVFLAIFQSFKKHRIIFLSISLFTLANLLSLFGALGFYSPWVNITFIDVLMKNSMLMLSNGALVLFITHVSHALPARVIKFSWYLITLTVFISFYAFSIKTIYLSEFFNGISVVIYIAMAGIIIIGRGSYNKLTIVAAYLILFQMGLSALTLLGNIDSLLTITILQPLSIIIFAYLLFFDQYFKSDSDISSALDEQHYDLNSQVPLFLRKFFDDLKIPVSSVLDFTNTLSETNLSVKQRSLLNTINSSTNEILRNSEKMYAFQRILAPQNHEAIKSLDLHNLIHKQVAALTLPASKKGIEVVCDIQQRVPKKALIDVQAIKFILTSLLNQSLNNTQSGEIICNVTRDDEKKVRVRITDTGQGIRAEELRQAFQLSQDENNDIQTTLPICAMLTKRIGGSIGASSELGRGSTYWFTLPIIAEVESSKFLSDAKKILRTVKILIIDDNNSSRKVIQQYATDIGIQVDSCRNAHEALVLMQTKNHLDQAFDFLFIDHLMPTISGVQLANRLKNNPRLSNYLNVVLMTDSNASKFDPLLKENGIDYILNKPVSSEEMYQLLLKSIPQFRDKNHF